MGLWLEQRDENGQLIVSARFESGVTTSGPIVTISEAREACRASAHLPPDRRQWALRIRFGDEE